MKKLILLFLVVFAVMPLMAQDAGSPQAIDEYIPVTLSAGTAMSGRTEAAALDDTTQRVDTRGYSTTQLLIVTATNDSVGISVKYQGSRDGVTWGQFVLIDSLTSTGTVGVAKSFQVPAAGQGFAFVRFRVEGTDAAHSANPSATLTSYVVRRKH